MEFAAAGAVHEGVVKGKEDVFLSVELSRDGFILLIEGNRSQDCDSPRRARFQMLPLLVMFPALVFSHSILVLLQRLAGHQFDRDVVTQVKVRDVRPVGVAGVFAGDAYAENGLVFDDGGEGGEEGGFDFGAGQGGRLGVEVAAGDCDAAVDAEVVAGGGEVFAGMAVSMMS